MIKALRIPPEALVEVPSAEKRAIFTYGALFRGVFFYAGCIRLNS